MANLTLDQDVDTFLQATTQIGMVQALGASFGPNSATDEDYSGANPSGAPNGVRIGYGAGDPGSAGGNTSDQIAIGLEAGKDRTTSGSDKSINIGRHAGDHGTGTQAICLGDGAGQWGDDAAQGIFIGYLAGRNHATEVVGHHHSFQAVVIGYEAATGEWAVAGHSDVIAFQTGVAIGSQSAKYVADGIGMVCAGYATGQFVNTLTNAVLIGNYAGRGGDTYSAGRNLANSILIGPRAGYSLNRANSLVIESNATYSDAGTGALIYGEFDNRILNFNAAVSVIGISTSSAFTVAGGTVTTSLPAISVTQAWNAGSSTVFSGIKARFARNGASYGVASRDSFLLDIAATNSADNSGASAIQFTSGGELLLGSGGTLGTATGNSGVTGIAGGAPHFGSPGGAAYLGNTSVYGGTCLIDGNRVAIPKGNAFAWSDDTTSYANSTYDLVLNRKAAATLQLGDDTSGPINQMITAANSTFNTVAGANLTIAAGNGVGASGGSLILATYDTGISTVAGTLNPWITITTTGTIQFGGGLIGFFGGTPAGQQTGIASRSNAINTAGTDLVSQFTIDTALNDHADAINAIRVALNTLGLTTTI